MLGESFAPGNPCGKSSTVWPYRGLAKLDRWDPAPPPRLCNDIFSGKQNTLIAVFMSSGLV